MRQAPLYLLLSTLCASPALQAEQDQPPSHNDNNGQIVALQQQLAESQRQLGELQSASDERTKAQISRLSQDNQRLKLQLKQAQAEKSQPLLSEQQLWYAIGGGTTLLAFVIGRLSAGGRNRRRSEWV